MLSIKGYWQIDLLTRAVPSVRAGIYPFVGISGLR